MKLAMIGLGKMGAGMTERLRRGGHEVVGYDRDPEISDVADLDAVVDALTKRRICWVMVPAGAPTQSTIEALADRLEPGDIVIDGGNARWHESVERGQLLSANGISFVDAGVSGGVWGLEVGFCLMVGGEQEAVDHLRPVLETLAPPSGLAHVGPTGAGHYTKMVHNAVEYGMMQAYAEGYELMEAAPVELDTEAAVEVWRHGSVVRSWLLDLLVQALEDDPGLKSVRGWANDSGEGRWAVQEAIDRAVPVPVMSAALYARFASRQDDSPAMKVIASLRNQFGGHATQAAVSPDDADA